MTETDTPDDGENSALAPLSAAARRALAEAEARRAEAEKHALEKPKELGRKGPDPARYGDWEKNGIASDF